MFQDPNKKENTLNTLIALKKIAIFTWPFYKGTTSEFYEKRIEIRW